MELTEKIRSFIVDNFLFGDAEGLENEASLLAAGVIDSTGFMELVTYLEDEFGIHVEDQDIVPENLDAISSIAAFTERKRRLLSFGSV